MTELSTEAQRRYARHLSLPEVGLAGQERLARASVLLVGAGGLGSPVALYLSAAGVGRLTLVDGDRVEASNLQRQVLYGERTLGARKVLAARERLADLNPLVKVEVRDERLVAANTRALVAAHDLVVDGTDNFATRYLLSDACVLEGKPLVYGSIYRFEGQVTVFDARRGPCYRCLFPSPPPPELAPSCAEGGVLGVLPGIVGTLQATEALKLLLGVGESLVGRLLAVDALGTHFGEYKVRKDPACPACGEHPTLRELVDLDAVSCATPAPVEEAVHAALPAAGAELSPRAAAALVAAGQVALLDVREPFEWEVAHLEGATLVPLAELEAGLASLPREKPWLVYCHHGVRSRRGLSLMQAAGFERVYNLLGGIDAWSREVDPKLPRY